MSRTQQHQFAICREKLAEYEREQFKTPRTNVSKRTQIADQIRNMKYRIDHLGKIGSLKMAIVIINVPEFFVPNTEDRMPSVTLHAFRDTLTFFFHDLDERSIEQIIRLKSEFQGRKVISCSIIDIPLGVGLESSLENNLLSWQIS